MEITNEKGEKVEVFTKEEVDVIKSEKAKLEKDLEETRMEVLTPEYTKFLESLSAPEEKPKSGGKEESMEDEDLSKLTPKQLIARAKKEAMDEFNATLDKQNKDTKAEKESRNKREITAFAKSHDDFEDFRPVMYGLSLKPENADLTLTQLYNASKEHVKKVRVGTSEEEKNKQKKLFNERPGSNVSTFDRKTIKSSTQYGYDALDEIEKELGPLPPA